MVIEKVIYDFYSGLFETQVRLPQCHLREDGLSCRLFSLLKARMPQSRTALALTEFNLNT